MPKFKIIKIIKDTFSLIGNKRKNIKYGLTEEDKENKEVIILTSLTRSGLL
jgi:hypothetical protein